MSLFSGQVTSDTPGDKKISFKGLEKCLEAFTSGEGRVVRKYARLFSQLSGKRQEDEEETISWSSSDEENGNTRLHNSSIVHRSKFSRKLNSQINFDNRISAKKNGRRITRAEFSRSVGHLSQDPFSSFPETKTSVENSLAVTEDSQSLFNAAILIDDSQDLTVGSRIDNDLPTLPLTPRREKVTSDGITSPVFKLNSSIKKRAKKRRSICRRTNDATVESSGEKIKKLCLQDLCVNNNTSETGVPLTPENKTIDEDYGLTSPILGQTFIDCRATVTSPVLTGAGDLSASPVILKSARRKRRNNHTVTVPSSPVLEPKNKAFKRKKRKLGVVKGNSQSLDGKTGSFGIAELLPIVECPVKRSLDFTAENKNDKNGIKIDENTDLAEKIGDVPVALVEKDNFVEDASQCLLDATNRIEEVNSEELDLSIRPQDVFRRPSRLSLRNAISKSKKLGTVSPRLETIEEDSQTQSLFKPEMKEDRVSFVRTKEAESTVEKQKAESFKKINLDQTNLIEEVYTEDLDLSMFMNPYFREVNSARGGVSRQDEETKLKQQIDGNSPTEDISSSQSLLENRLIDTDPPQSKILSVMEASEEMQKEFRSRHTRSSERELVISQSSTRSGDLLKSDQMICPEIESVSSPISRVNLETSGPLFGAISTSSATRSPGVSSPLVISSAGSSPGVKVPDVPFVILEDEFNAPPKRRSKKLDPNGLASRLQRLLNQRRSAARIWQYKCSKLNRTSNREEEKTAEESRGRVLTVFSVRTDYSHIVLLSKEDKGILSNGKEFRSSVLVVLDPGVVVRLSKIKNATRIKIFPPWQSMDFVDHDITVILGANIVEVLSTERDTFTSLDAPGKSQSIQKYTCRCLSPSPPDAVILECWDGVQSIGILDLLFPLASPSSTQLVQFNENVLPTVYSPYPSNSKREQAKYSIQALLSTQSTACHGKGLLALTVLRILCYRQRSFGLPSSSDTSLHWSLIGRDDASEVCELVLGQIQNVDEEMRCDWSDFISGRALGKKYKFRGVAVSQRLDRSRLCGEWDIVPEKQNIVYVLAPSNQFSFSVENSDPTPWEPEISSLVDYVGDGAKDGGLNKPTRVSFVCRIFHANEQALYVSDPSVSPQLCFVAVKQSTFIPPVIFTAVQKPSPSRILVFLQDFEISKGNMVADKYSRIIVLNERGRAYSEGNCRERWPTSPEICSTLRGLKVQLPQFSPRSRTHNLVKLTGIVSDLDETSALMWPGCGSCGSPVSTEEKNVHHCPQCSKKCKQLIVHMSLILFVKCPDFPDDVSIRVKILHKTVEALLRTLPQEGQDIRVREALGKPIGPIRCEVVASHGGNFVLNELPSSLWM